MISSVLFRDLKYHYVCKLGFGAVQLAWRFGIAHCRVDCLSHHPPHHGSWLQLVSYKIKDLAFVPLVVVVLGMKFCSTLLPYQSAAPALAVVLGLQIPLTRTILCRIKLLQLSTFMIKTNAVVQLLIKMP